MSAIDDQDAWGQLLRPWAATRWFEAEPLPPLDPAASSFSPANAWWLAELSRLCYRNAQRGEALATAGLAEVAFLSRGGTQCLCAAPAGAVPGAILCAFRGTDEPRDWWSNLRIVPADWPGGGRVHRGFRDALEDAWSVVEEVLDASGLPVLLGGHSLGGALAVLAASRRACAGCYTFGAPLVGDAGFAATLDDAPIFRVVHGRDLVPSLPPSTPALRVVAAGREVRLDPVVESRTWNDPPARLADHAPARYVEALRRLWAGGPSDTG